jgi:preprotein translocase subunit SecG
MNGLKWISTRATTIASLLGIAWRIAIGCGVVITAAYCMLTHSLPNGLGIGDTFIFLVIVVSFGIIYLILLAAGASSAVWIIQCVAYLANRRSTKVELHPMLKGWPTAIPSMICFAVLAIVFWVNPNLEFLTVAVLFFVTGLVLIMITGVNVPTAQDTNQPAARLTSAPVKQSPLLALIAVMALLPLFNAPSLLLNMTMEAIGIRAAKSHVALMSMENFRKVQIAAFAGFVPLYACISPQQEDQVLVFRVDLDWHGIGSTAYARILSAYKDPSSGETPKSIRLALDDSGITPISGDRFVVREKENTTAKQPVTIQDEEIGKVTSLVKELEKPYRLPESFATPNRCIGNINHLPSTPK